MIDELNKFEGYIETLGGKERVRRILAIAQHKPSADEVLRGALKYAEDNGIRFLVGNYEVDADEAVAWLKDSEQAEADWEGVTVEQYRRFQDCGGVPQCGARTTKGHRCKCLPVGAKFSWGAKDFVRFDGEYCSIHGGF